MPELIDLVFAVLIGLGLIGVVAAIRAVIRRGDRSYIFQYANCDTEESPTLSATQPRNSSAI